MRPDGSHQRILVADEPHRADGQVQPDFSPSGGRIAVSRGAHLVTMRLNGTRRVVLNRSGILVEPTYSPNGRRIAAYQAHRGTRFVDIVVMKLDGSRRRAVRRHLASLFGISWQPLPGG